jgi:hypothetical protein
VLLGDGHDADRGRPARDEQDAGHPGQPGAEASAGARRGDKAALRPGHDDPEPGYAALLALADAVASLGLPQDALIA